MRSKLMSFGDGFVLDGDRPRAATDRRGHFDGNPDIGRDAYRLHEGPVGMGSIVVSLVWLAFYVIATVDPLISEHAQVASTVKPQLSIALPSSR
jgi:hypothetical protein